MADEELRAWVRDFLMKGYLCGDGFERMVKVGGTTREELVENFIDLFLPQMGPRLKEFHAEHGFYPDSARHPGERAKGDNN